MFRKHIELKSVHCIIHQELFYAKKLKLEHVMDVVINSELDTLLWLQPQIVQCFP